MAEKFEEVYLQDGDGYISPVVRSRTIHNSDGTSYSKSVGDTVSKVSKDIADAKTDLGRDVEVARSELENAINSIINGATPAKTATQLASPVKINGVSFDGTKNIKTIPLVYSGSTDITRPDKGAMKIVCIDSVNSSRTLKGDSTRNVLALRMKIYSSSSPSPRSVSIQFYPATTSDVSLSFNASYLLIGC